jgi:sugar phosphate isomerase/epimerase
VKLSLVVQTPEVPTTIPVALLSGSFEEKAARAASLGAHGLELMAAEPAALDASAMRRSLRSHGLEAVAIGTGAVVMAHGLTLLHRQPEVAAQAEARLGELVSLAAAIGAPLVTIGSFRGRQVQAGADGRGLLADILRRAASTAESMGIRLALEPLNRYEADLVNNAEQGLAFLEEVDHPALGLLLDTYHMNIEERSWTEPFRRLMAAGKLWHVHLGDNNRLAPGRGLIDFAAIVATLGGIGYEGYLSAEHLALPDPETAAAQTLSTMRPLLEATSCG